MLCDPVFSAKRRRPRLDSTFHIPWATYSGFQNAGFRIPWAKIFLIPDCTSKNFLDSGLYKQKFSRFRIVQGKIFPIPDCTIKNFLDSGLYKQKFSRFRNEQAKIFPIPDCTGKNFFRFRNPNSLSWGKWQVDLLFQTLKNRFILNRLYIYNLYPWRLTAIILSVSGMTRSPTCAPTISPPWHFFFKQNRCLCQKKCFYLKNKLDS